MSDIDLDLQSRLNRTGRKLGNAFNKRDAEDFNKLLLERPAVERFRNNLDHLLVLNGLKKEKPDATHAAVANFAGFSAPNAELAMRGAGGLMYIGVLCNKLGVSVGDMFFKDMTAQASVEEILETASV